LKAHGLFADASPRETPFSTPQLQVLAVEVEAVLGVWLLSGLWPRAAWAAALALFAALAGASLYLALDGQRSCGCFGRVEVSPWWTAGLDVAAITLLALIRPQPVQAAGEPLGRRLSRSPALTAVAGAVILLGLGAGGLTLAFESPGHALAYLRGESVLVEPAVSDVGSAPPGVATELRITIKNLTDHAIRLTGGMQDCTCLTTQDLPVSVPAHGNVTVRVVLGFRGSPGKFQQRFHFYTDESSQPVLIGRAVGRVLPRDRVVTPR
jgi:hypothetical protein